MTATFGPREGWGECTLQTFLLEYVAGISIKMITLYQTSGRKNELLELRLQSIRVGTSTL